MLIYELMIDLGFVTTLRILHIICDGFLPVLLLTIFCIHLDNSVKINVCTITTVFIAPCCMESGCGSCKLRHDRMSLALRELTY